MRARIDRPCRRIRAPAQQCSRSGVGRETHSSRIVAVVNRGNARRKAVPEGRLAAIRDERKHQGIGRIQLGCADVDAGACRGRPGHSQPPIKVEERQIRGAIRAGIQRGRAGRQIKDICIGSYKLGIACDVVAARERPVPHKGELNVACSEPLDIAASIRTDDRVEDGNRSAG